MALDLVRVRAANGTETSVGRAFAKKHGLKPLDKPATRHGHAIPAKHRVSVAEAAENKKTNTAGSDTSASSKEESK